MPFAIDLFLGISENFRIVNLYDTYPRSYIQVFTETGTNAHLVDVNAAKLILAFWQVSIKYL